MDGNKVANQLTVRGGNYPGLFVWGWGGEKDRRVC